MFVLFLFYFVWTFFYICYLGPILSPKSSLCQAQSSTPIQAWIEAQSRPQLEDPVRLDTKPASLSPSSRKTHLTWPKIEIPCLPCMNAKGSLARSKTITPIPLFLFFSICLTTDLIHDTRTKALKLGQRNSWSCDQFNRRKAHTTV